MGLWDNADYLENRSTMFVQPLRVLQDVFYGAGRWFKLSTVQFFF